MAYIHSYDSFGGVDGPGVRYIIFLQGCPLRCKYCHNRDTWNKEQAGIIESAQETFAAIDRKKQYYCTSGGVTVSGGEPFAQPEYVLELFKLCKQANLHTAADTSGYCLNSKVKEALFYTDLVLLDIKSIDENQHKELTGVSLSPILKFLDYLVSINKPVWLRHVLVPTITYNEKLLKQLAEFLKQIPVIKKIELLKYHTMGIQKWTDLGLTYPLQGIPPLTEEQLNKAKKIFKQAGFFPDCED